MYAVFRFTHICTECMRKDLEARVGWGWVGGQMDHVDFSGVAVVKHFVFQAFNKENIFLF